MFLCFSLFMIKPTVALSPVQAYFTFQRASIQPILIGLKAVPVQMMQTVICRTDWLTYCEDLTKQQRPGLTNAHMLVPKNFSSSMATWGHCKNESEPTDSHIKMAKIKKTCLQPGTKSLASKDSFHNIMKVSSIQRGEVTPLHCGKAP